MFTMEFEEMQKIWDTQNDQPLYVINEASLHKRIMAKRNQARFKSNITDIGLIIIALGTATILVTTGSGSVYSYLSAAVLALIAVYVFVERLRRQRRANQFDRSMLGDLDEAISNVSYEAFRAKNFVWWFLLPTVIPAFLNMSQSDAPLWKWFVVPIAFVLAFALTRWELNKVHQPKKRGLQALRKKLMEEVDQGQKA